MRQAVRAAAGLRASLEIRLQALDTLAVTYGQSSGGGAVIPTLTDGVLILNGFTDDDVPDHVAGEDEETARRFGWWPQKSTEEDALNAFRRYSQSWATGGPTRTFAARNAATGCLVGGCELRLQDDGSAQVSYWTQAAARQNGYATRALCLLVDYGRSIGVTGFEAHVAVDNVASRRVSEKAGFELAGTFIEEDGTAMVRYHQPCNR